jgi:hypothetical protein
MSVKLRNAGTAILDKQAEKPPVHGLVVVRRLLFTSLWRPGDVEGGHPTAEHIGRDGGLSPHPIERSDH